MGYIHESQNVFQPAVARWRHIAESDKMHHLGICGETSIAMRELKKNVGGIKKHLTCFSKTSLVLILYHKIS